RSTRGPPRRSRWLVGAHRPASGRLPVHDPGRAGVRRHRHGVDPARRALDGPARAGRAMIAALLGAAAVAGAAWWWRPPPARLAAMISPRRTAIPAGVLV